MERRRTEGTTTGRNRITTMGFDASEQVRWPRSDPRAVGAAGGLADPGERIDVDDDTPVLWDEVPAEKLCVSCVKLRPLDSFASERQKTCRRCTRANARIHRGVAPVFAWLEPSDRDTCAICGTDGGDKGLFLDHNHATGAMRGWLCHHCNAGIGHFKDDPALLARAIGYVLAEPIDSHLRVEAP